MKKRQFNIKLPDHLIRAVKMKAFENYRDTSREVEIALRNHLDMHDDLHVAAVKAARETN
jgi:hypothetical protein|tara:strand:- start:793 stop:972 length:180 start_codon:yes stop_codon:yes gene_type:complete